VKNSQLFRIHRKSKESADSAIRRWQGAFQQVFEEIRATKVQGSLGDKPFELRLVHHAP
jgi:hypothetical protein